MNLVCEDSGYNTKLVQIDFSLNQRLQMIYGGNGDLYWIYDDETFIDSKNDPMNTSILIDKDNPLYKLFLNLYNDLITGNIFYPESSFSNNPVKECNELNKDIVNNYRYQDLVKKDIIEWYSDEERRDITEILRISKNDSGILITFIRQSKRDDLGFRREPGYYSIRFRFDGSYYGSCFMPFYRLYDNLCHLNNIKDNNETYRRIKKI